MASVSGKLMAYTIGGVKYRCQTDGNITITRDVAEDDPCKDSGLWKEHTVVSKSWTGSFSAKAFMDSVAGNQLDAIDLMIGPDVPVEIEFLTTPGDHDFPVNVVLAGEAFMTSLDWANPASGASTYSVDFTGNGALVKTEIPVV